ncbi:MAG: acyltransferase [Candidatus Beckwithbacteria bacterium]
MTRFKNWQRPKFDDKNVTKWNWMCSDNENLEIGKNSDIGAFTYIKAKFGVKIGGDVQIGSHCSIYSENTIDKTQGKIVIKKGAMVGSHSVILPNVTIGEEAIVGAFSLVKKDVPAGQVFGGVPARKIK